MFEITNGSFLSIWLQLFEQANNTQTEKQVDIHISDIFAQIRSLIDKQDVWTDKQLDI